MKTISLITLRRGALAAVVLVPAAACAKPADQAVPSQRGAAATAAGVTLSAFVSRRGKHLLAADTDGDGKVSRAEFLAERAGKGNPVRRFAKLDRNGDGLLDKAEIDAMQGRGFARLDANGDGLLSADERAAVGARKAKDAGNRSGS